MQLLLDLRYGVPPVINLILLFLTSQGFSPGNQDGALGIDQHPKLMVPFLVLALFTLLFLLTSIKFPLVAGPIQLRIGDFSGPLTISLLGFLILPPPLFWVAYFILIVISPWYGMILNLFKCFLQWLYHTLRTIPTIIVICITQRQENLQPGPPQAELLDIEGCTMQDAT